MFYIAIAGESIQLSSVIYVRILVTITTMLENMFLFIYVFHVYFIRMNMFSFDTRICACCNYTPLVELLE